MAIRFIPARRVRKVKTKNSQEVLRRLEEYLEGNCDGPVEILCGFWKDQQDAITYQEIRQAVLDGTISQKTVDWWMQDYSILVAAKLSSLWTDAIAAGPAGQPILDGLVFEFNTQTPGILRWINEHGAEFVTASTQEQRDAIAALLTKKMRDSHTVDELARLIRPCIGLTERQAKANVRYYDSIVENLKRDHPRMKPESIRRKALDAATKYAERQHRERAMTIAQTESAFAYNKGADESIRQAQAQNLLGAVKKRWSTSGDDSVCDICSALDGVEIDMDSDFDIRGRILFAGRHMLPPAHPRCACAVEYIEVRSQTNMSQQEGVAMMGNSGEDIENKVVATQKIGSIDPSRTNEAIKYYGNQIRNQEMEHVVIIDKRGNVYHAAGNAVGVVFSGVNYDGASIIHNHPESNGIVSFGKNDFYFLQDNQNLASLQCVNPKYNYMIRVLKDISGISYNELYKVAILRYSFSDDFDIQHETMNVLKERGYVEYVRTIHTT